MNHPINLMPSPSPSKKDPSLITMRFYIDIDGVFSAHQPPFPNTLHVPDKEAAKWFGEWHNDGFPTSMFESLPPDAGDIFHICWPEELINEINALNELPHVEFIWLTTWRVKAFQFAQRVGLNAQEWKYFDTTWSRIVDKNQEWWKQSAIDKHLAENPVEKAFWLEDEFYMRPEVKAWAEKQDSIIIIEPNPKLGIDAELFDFMKQAMVLS